MLLQKLLLQPGQEKKPEEADPLLASNIPVHELEIGTGGDAGGLWSHVGNRKNRRWTWQAIEKEAARQLLGPVAEGLTQAASVFWTSCLLSPGPAALPAIGQVAAGMLLLQDMPLENPARGSWKD